MVVLECRQRMGGYDYIISHDLDEMIIPRENVTQKTFLNMIIPRENVTQKTFLKDHVTKYPRAAAFFFYTEFFLTTWPPSNPEEDLMVKRYSQQLTPDVAILHHYRQCPEDTWKACDVESNVDDIMTRYTKLDERVLKVRTETSTQPRWTPVKNDKSRIALT